MKKLTSAVLLVVSMSGLQGCFSSSSNDPVTPAPPPPPPPAATTIVDVAVGNGSFTTLVAALQATGLDEVLADPEATFTVFAPTDEAFAALGQETIDALLADPDALASILTYHVVAGEVNAEAAIAAAGSTVPTVNTANIGLALLNETLFVNQAAVVTTDVMADNGIIHVIDAVLTPPVARGEPTMNIVETALAAGNFTTLIAAAQAAGLDGVLADESEKFTVFAPTDAAFAMIDEETINTLLANPDVLSSILLQHVLPGQVDAVTAFSAMGTAVETASGANIPVNLNLESRTLTFGGANVVVTDIHATNGIIHVIDMVVVADVDLPQPAQTIVDVAAGDERFSTLVAVLEATGLDLVLADTSTEFTVFAPTNAAFELLGEETINSLLANPEALSNVLLYHVIAGSTILQDAAVTVAQSSDRLVTMANEQQAALSITDNTLYVNRSAVALTDVMASNGVIHVLDQVIVPPADRGEPTQSIVDVALANEEFSTLVDALVAADLVDALADESATFTVFAPTNTAFAKIPTATLESLLGDVEALSGILLQHVVGDAEISSVTAFSANGGSVTTLAENNLTVRLVNFTQAANDNTTEVAYDAANQRLVGGLGSAKPGFTLYVFDNDLGTTGSTCNEQCAVNWPPVLVTDGDVSSVPGLSVVTRDDGSLQAAYQGRPLYFFANDEAVGDINGDGVGGRWFKVSQEQVSLQIQGSNVITKDIYTTNGVIHVIDTVITSAE